MNRAFPNTPSFIEEVTRLRESQKTVDALLGEIPNDRTRKEIAEEKVRITALATRLHEQMSTPMQGMLAAGAELLERLYSNSSGTHAAGAYGDIWLGRTVSDPSRKVVVKIFRHEDLADGSKCYYFFRGLRAMKKLSNTDSRPSTICQFIHEDETGLAYSMEYVGDNDLSRISSLGWPLDKKLEILFDISKAIAFAHNVDGKRIIHRDIRPQNVVVSNDGTRACLIDFDASELVYDVTQTSSVLSPLPYSAPELHDRTKGVVRGSVSSDVYSFGCLIVFVLSESINTFDPSQSVAVAKKKYGTISSRFLDHVRQCIDENPAVRPKTMLDVASALELARRDIANYPSTVRRRSLAALALAAVVGLVSFYANATTGCLNTQEIVRRRTVDAAMAPPATQDLRTLRTDAASTSPEIRQSPDARSPSVEVACSWRRAEGGRFDVFPVDCQGPTSWPSDLASQDSPHLDCQDPNDAYCPSLTAEHLEVIRTVHRIDGVILTKIRECMNHNAASCEGAWSRIRVIQETTDARLPRRKYLERLMRLLMTSGCSLGECSSCWSAASSMMNGFGGPTIAESGRFDPSDALLAHGCINGGCSSACLRAAGLDELPPDLMEAVRDRGCRLHERRLCPQ